jgi:hypothetical protein
MQPSAIRDAMILGACSTFAVGIGWPNTPVGHFRKNNHDEES